MLLASVAVEPIPETYVVEVKITNNDPKDAALWANTLADIYMDYSIEGQVEAAKRAYKWVTERLAETQTGMEQAQDKLLKSYQGQDLFVPEGSVSAITTSITKLTEDHIQAQARRIELEAQLGEFQEARRRGRGTDAIPQVAGDQSVAEINGKIQSLNVDLARLREKYKEGHPEVQKIQVQVQQLRKDKDARVGQIEESLRAEYRQLQRKESELKAAIDDHKGRAADQSLKMTELESLKKQADSAAGLYSVLLQKLNETNIAASIQNNNVRLLDRAVVPSEPGVAAQAPGRARGPAGRAAAGRGLRAAARRARQHAQGRRRRRAAPAPRAARGDPPLRQGRRDARDRGLPEPAHGTAVLAPRRRGPGGARDRHRPGRGQDDDAAERGEAARGVGRERRRGGLRPAAREPAPAAQRAARARLHRLLREGPGHGGAGADAPASRTSR